MALQMTTPFDFLCLVSAIFPRQEMPFVNIAFLDDWDKSELWDMKYLPINLCFMLIGLTFMTSYVYVAVTLFRQEIS